MAPGTPPDAPAGVITWPDRGSRDDRDAAARWADRLGLPLVPRRGVARLAREHGVPAVLVVGAARAALHVPPEPHPLKFHGGLGRLRIDRLAAGGADALVAAAALEPGDRVVDATAGSGTDALVLAHAVGPHGTVVAVEGAPLLAALLTWGLAHPLDASPAVEAARRRITVAAADHRTWLADQPADSAAVVVFDPMFEAPARARDEYGVLRRLARPEPLTQETLALAARVASRRVVVVDDAAGTTSRRLGLALAAAGAGARRRYGVLDLTAAARP